MDLTITTINELSSRCVPLLWRASWQGGVALILILVLCQAVRKIPARVQCWLWRLAFLKLLIVGLWIVPLEIRCLPPVEPVKVSGESELSAPEASFYVPAEATSLASPQVQTEPRAETRSLSVLSWLLVAWSLGAMISLAKLLKDWVGVRRVRSILAKVTDERVLSRVIENCRQFSISRPPDVRLVPDSVRPCLVGILRPVIVLPSAIVESCSAEQLDVVLTHELAHIKRRDLLWNWLPVLAEAAFFFHPLVWLAKRELCLAQEIATDELAVSSSPVNVASYARSLVDLAAKYPPVASPSLAVAVTESYSQLSRRIIAMKTFQKLTARHRLTLTIAVLAITVVGIVPWKLTAQEAQAPIEITEIVFPKAGPADGDYVKTHWNADPSKDIFRIGTFKKADEGGLPAGWEDLSAFKSGFARLDTERRGIVTLIAPMGKGEVAIQTTLELPPKTEHVSFMVRLRGPKIKRDEKAGAGGGVTFSFIDAEGRNRNLPRIDPSYDGYRNWLTQVRTAQVRPGESKLRVSIALKDATGNLDVDDILIVPSDSDGEATAEQRSALTTAIQNDDPAAIAQLIKEDPRMLEMRTGDDDNGTPLIRAAWGRSTKVAAKLIELGAKIEAVDYNWRNTPLRWCCWWGNHEVGEVLLRAGVKTRGASRMAQNAKTGNPWTSRSKEDFDKLSKLIDDDEAKRAQD